MSDGHSINGIQPLDMASLAKFGTGRITAELKEDLRKSLVKGFTSTGFGQGLNPDAVQEEVEKFLQNGHISGSNLSRLERRVIRRTQGDGARPATGLAGDQRTASSEFSAAPASARSAPRSARSLEGRPSSQMSQRSQRSQAQAFEGGSRTPVSARGLYSSGLHAVGETRPPATPKWSEVANYAKVLENKEKAEHRLKKKTKQEEMRQDLQKQMVEKDVKKAEGAEEDKKIFWRQKAELKAWHEAESAIVEEQKKVALEVRQERVIQSAVVTAIREDERQKKLQEDDQLVKRAAEGLEEEKKAALAKKNQQREAMSSLIAEWEQDRKNRDEQKKQQANYEKDKVNEYQKMLDDQEERNRQNIVPARMPMGTYSPPNKAERRKEERVRDEQMMLLVRKANAKAAEAEMRKTEQKNTERHANQEFLFTQIRERDASRKQGEDDVKKQKERVEAEAAEYMEVEKQRVEHQRMKNIQHRLELEKQIESKKPPSRFKKRHNEDLMSAAEVAINWHLLQDAREMQLTASEAEKCF